MARNARERLPQGDVDLTKPATKADIWNGWTKNYRNEGYVIHGVDVRYHDFRALCGVKIEETGMLDMTEPGWSVDCLKCRRKLLTMGLLEAKDVEPRYRSKAWVKKYCNVSK